MLSWLRRSVTVSCKPASTPPGVRLYAVGDVHGRADLLSSLDTKICVDVSRHPEKTSVVIYLGDYIDRGPQSRDVIEYLSTGVSGLRQQCLMGNHEEAMLAFLSDPLRHANWLDFGGLETLVSYDVGYRADDVDSLVDTAATLKAALPPHHLEFLEGLESYSELGDYLFVHAGIRPGVPIGAQRAGDMRWIRSAFLSYEQPHPRMVVHGHHITDRVDLRSNRIGIDTGAYATGCLSCLILDGTDRLVLDTRHDEPYRLTG